METCFAARGRSLFYWRAPTLSQTAITARRSLSAMPAARALARLADYDVIFIRHGNTAPAEKDLERRLTDKGKKQCGAAAAGYMARLPSPLAPYAVTSPALRCVETASLIVPGIELVEVQCMYDGMIQPGASEAFRRLGYASLAQYLSDSDETRSLLSSHGEHVVGALGATATVRVALDAADGKAPKASQRQTMCVFGHAVYLNAAALRLADLRAHPIDGKQAILHTNTEEATGFWVGGVTSEVLRR